MSTSLSFERDPIDQPAATDPVERLTWCSLRIRVGEQYVLHRAKTRQSNGAVPANCAVADILIRKVINITACRLYYRYNASESGRPFRRMPESTLDRNWASGGPSREAAVIRRGGFRSPGGGAVLGGNAALSRFCGLGSPLGGLASLKRRH